MKKFMRVCTTLFFLTFGASMSLTAQGWIEPTPGRPNAVGVVKIRTAVRVTVTDRIAEVEVEEWFRNDGPRFGEGDYIYPLPGEAVFSNFSLFQGDEELRGETMDAQQARSIYEEIVRRKRDPALIELVGHGLIRARVFPFNTGETRKITLRFTQVLERAGDALTFRYAGGTRRDRWAPTTPSVERPGRGPDRAPMTFELLADDEAFGDPFSPTHRVRVERRDGQLRVRPEAELSGSFALFLPLAGNTVGVTVATHRPTANEDGYFMLTLSPGEADGAVMPRDLTVVIDVSGSMSGTKIEQAKAAVVQLLGTLDRADRFRLIAFNNRVTAHAGDWQAATREGLARGRRWVRGIEASGGTNIAGALEEAFSIDPGEGRLPMTVFLTDGLPSVGEKNPEAIAETAGRDRGNTRIFAFGVGYDVNTLLLDRLTAEGHGATQYVQPGEDVERALSTLATKIRHPVLADLEIGDAPVQLTEVYPVDLPDLFSGEDLVVFGRYEMGRRDRSGRITIRGQRNGRSERFSTTARFARHELSNDFIPRLWASRKLGFLTRTLRLEGRTPELVEEIRETALRYGLLSEFTSYLVQEPEMLADTRPIGLNRAEGNRATRRLEERRDSAVQSRPAVAAAPQAVGRDAVRTAEAARRQREVSSQAELEDADEQRMDALGPNMRRVHGRTFVLKRDVWTDLMHTDSMPVIDIEPYGEAYFELLRLLPEIEPWLAAMDKVLVAGARQSVRIVPGGLKRISGADLARLVRDFRNH